MLASLANGWAGTSPKQLQESERKCFHYNHQQQKKQQKGEATAGVPADEEKEVGDYKNTTIHEYVVRTSGCHAVHTVSSLPPPISEGTTTTNITGHKVIRGNNMNNNSTTTTSRRRRNGPSSTTFVLLHGFFTGAVQYSPNWNLFASRGDVFAFDLPTNGRSDGFAEGKLDQERKGKKKSTPDAQMYIDVLCAVLEEWLQATVMAHHSVAAREDEESEKEMAAINNEPRSTLVFVGHSFGAYLITHFLAGYFKREMSSSSLPQRKYQFLLSKAFANNDIRLVLLDPFGFKPTPSPAAIRAHYADKNVVQRSAAWTFRVLIAYVGICFVVRMIAPLTNILMRRHTTWMMKAFPPFQEYFYHNFVHGGNARRDADRLIGAVFTGTSFRIFGEGITAKINASPLLTSSVEMMCVPLLVVCGGESWLDGKFVAEAVERRTEARRKDVGRSFQDGCDVPTSTRTSALPLDAIEIIEEANHHPHTQFADAFARIFSSWFAKVV